jgi:RNA polymerase sigma-70 factor (ECF subfamily)
MGSHDADLVERWQQGDAAAFAELVRLYTQPVARVLHRLLGQSELVNDLCQEVFLRVHQATRRYRENGAFQGWLYRIAINVARDAVRRGKRNPVPLLNREVRDRPGSAEAAYQQQELTEHITRALAELPDTLRVVLVLRHYERMSFEDIARLTGTPASTLKSRFAAALGRLRLRLQKLGWGPEESET